MKAGTDFSVKYPYAKELSFRWEILVSNASRDKLVLLLGDLTSLLYGGGHGYIFLCQCLPQHLVLSMV